MRPNVLSALAASAPLWLKVAGSPPVKVSLRTSWPAPALLLEIIESAALDNDYFAVLDLLTSDEALSASIPLADQATYESSLELLQSHGLLNAPGSREALELALALHTTAPKIEAFYQFYADANANAVPDPECASFVDWYGDRICDAKSLKRRLDVDRIASDGASSQTAAFVRPPLLSVDHVYPSLASTLAHPNRTAILYADVFSPNFRQLHNALYEHAKPAAGEHQIQYVVRYAPPTGNRDDVPRSYLSGWGVALDLKKMDYLAMDDRRTSSGEDATDPAAATQGTPEDESEAVRILTELVAGVPEDQKAAQLTQEEVSAIGLAASQLILKADNKLEMLRHIAQDFPRYALALARGDAQYDDELAAEVTANHMRVGPGVSVLWLNGMMVQDLDAFSLLGHMRRERTIMTSLMNVGLNAEQAFDVITHSAVVASQQGGASGVTDGIFDASDRSEGKNAISWLNDIATGDRYASWSGHIASLQRQLFPGQFPRVKYNLWNVVLVVDFSRTDSIQLVAESIGNVIKRTFPFRFGVVPLVETEEQLKAARLYNYLFENYGPDATSEFLIGVLQQGIVAGNLDRIDWDAAKNQLPIMASKTDALTEDFEAKDFDAIVAGSEEEPRIKAARAYAQRLSITPPDGIPGYGFVNGKFFDLDDAFFQHLQSEVSSMTEYIVGKLRSEEITDETDFDNYWYDLPTSSKTRSLYVFPNPKTNPLRIVNLPEVFERTGFSSKFQGFTRENSAVPLVTIWIVADLDSVDGVAFFKQALKGLSLNEGPSYRLAVVHNGPVDNAILDTSVPQTSRMVFLESSAGGVPPEEVLGLINVLENHDYGDKTVAALLSIMEKSGRHVFDAYHQASKLLARELKFKEGENGILVNGRIIGPIHPGGFVAQDFASLAAYESAKRAEPTIAALSDIEPELLKDDKKLSDMVAAVTSILGALQIPDPTSVGLFQQQPQPRTKVWRTALEGQHSSFKIGDPSKAIFNFAFVVDPISDTAQKRVDLLELLAKIPSAHVEVYLNPFVGKREEEGLPLKKFYRSNIKSKLEFNVEGAQVAPAVKFEGLPVDPIYTLSMDVHQSWLVRPHESQHDLDNIHLATLSPRDAARGVEALFRLDYLVVEGHARETTTQSPPRGVQLQLATIGEKAQPIADTLVVANLGYLQFKAKPGVYRLEIREGRGREIFALDSAGGAGWDSPSVEQAGADVALAGFDGITLYPRFSRNPGKEKSDVLDAADSEDEQSGSIVDKVSQFFASLGGKKEETKDIVVADPPKQADINIFTVASGHLYERFASIMILSVLRHTNKTVKFWFIENFLSPSFLEFIPHFAEQYNFQYELVTYKWPSWLRAQKEKQRIIWGYKILFLDVLFPMDLKKVIFVDADQIVRTDLMELVDLDLEGAPYGYTPMGDDNEAMEGFRFWKTGYWKDFLRGKPYHISALYVIDLVRFRQLAAGDRLRGSYQGLSADPNSLANLDQDLPNNLQFDVPIFSLDKSWLWCETWCSMDRLAQAKTIDLCQNPLTKEPKLDRARQIPEWSEYDSEIARFARSLADKGLIKSDAAAGSIDKLASVGKKSTTEAADEATSSTTGEAATDATSEASQDHVRDEL